MGKAGAGAAVSGEAVEIDISEADELAGIAEAEAAGRDKLEPPKEKPAKADKPADQPRDDGGKFKGKAGEEPAKDAQPEPPEKSRTVPHQAFHEERENRKAAERELAKERREYAEKLARLDERLAILNQAFQPQPQARPDPKKDIFGYAEMQEQRLNRLERQDQERTQADQQAQTRQQQEQRLWAGARQSAARFRQSQPDFDAAYQFALNSRYAELQVFGHDEASIADQIKQDELAIVTMAAEGGYDPAETIYRWAQGRGYTPKQAQPAAGQAQAATDAQEPAKGKGNGAEQIQRLTDAQEASQTLSGGGGGPAGNGKLSLEAIDRMSNDEFKALTQKMNRYDPEGMDKLMMRLEGGAAR